MGNRLGLETEASEQDRILQSALARVAKPKAEAPATPGDVQGPKNEPSYKGSLTAGKEALVAAGSKIKGAVTGSDGGNIADRGLAAGEGVAELAGGIFAPIQQLISNVVAAQGGDAEMPKDVARVIRGIQHTFTMPKQVVKEVFAGSKEAQAEARRKYEEGRDAELDQPMTWAEGLSFLGATAAGGKLATSHGKSGAVAEKPLTAKAAKAAADKAAFDQQLSDAAGKDTKAAQDRAARRAAEQKAFDETAAAEPNPKLKQAPAVDEALATAGIEPQAAPENVTLYRHGKPSGPLSNFGESPGMVSPFADAGALHSMEVPSAVAEQYRKSNILNDPNADPAIKAEIERQGGMPDREFLLPEEVAQGAQEHFVEGTPIEAAGGTPKVQVEDLSAREPAVQKTEGMPGAAAEAQINAELGVPPSEIVVKPRPAAEEMKPVVPDPVVEEVPVELPQVQTLAEAHNIAQTVTADAMPQVADSGRMAQEFVKALRTSTGFSREQLQAQGSEIVKFLEKTASKADVETIAIDAEMLRIRTRLTEIATELGPGNEAMPSEIADVLARRVTASLLDPKSLETQPESAVKALTDVGVKKTRAEGIVNGIVDAYKASGLSDETGHMFFWAKDETKAQPVYDVKAAEIELGTQAKDNGLVATLKLNALGKKAITPEQLVAAQAARDVATGRVTSILRRVEAGAAVRPGELFDSATLAGAVADKARVVDGRLNDPGRIHGGTHPIKPENLARFADYLRREMTEPEMYSKLKSLEPYQQQQWLANLYRTSDLKGVKGMYMSLYVGSKLTGPETLVRATAGDAIMLPMDIASTALGAQIGKILPGDTHILPGEASIRAMSYWKTIRDQMSMIGRRDWDGIKTQMVTEGEWNPPIAHPTSLFGNVVNAIAGAPTYYLGAERASTKIINRIGELEIQAHLQAMKEGPKGSKEYVQAVEHYRRNPTVDMIRDADAHADQQAFSAKLDGIAGSLQEMGNNNGVKVLVSPFPRIDIGILDYTLQGTPGLNFASKQWRDAMKEGGRARDRALGRTATGTAVIGTGMLFGMQGLVTGDGPSDPAQKKIWELAGGRSNYIYNPATGKPMVSHLALGPISGWLAMGADLSFMLRHVDENSGKQLMAGALHALGEPITHAGYLEAWGNVVGAIKNGFADDDWLRFVRQKIADMGLVRPAIVSYVTRQVQPEGKPDLATPRGNLIEREFKLLKDEITAGMPGWSKGFPTVKNFLTYEPIPRDGLAPWNKEVTKDPVAIKLDDLGQKVGRTIIAPPDFIGGDRPTEGLAEEKQGEGVRLEAWEKDRLLQIMAKEIEIKGLTLHEALAYEFKSDKYVNAPTDDARASRIFSLYTAFKHAAQGKLLQEDKHLAWLVAEQQVKDARKQGADVDNPLGPMPPPTKYPRPSQVR